METLFLVCFVFGTNYRFTFAHGSHLPSGILDRLTIDERLVQKLIENAQSHATAMKMAIAIGTAPSAALGMPADLSTEDDAERHEKRGS